MVVAQFFNALNFITEEYLMERITIKVEKVVAIEGITGLILCCLLYLPFRLITSLQAGDSVEIVKPFEDIKNHFETCILVISMIIVIGALNYFLVKTIKIADSLALCTIDSGRVILVWILAIAFNLEDVLPIEITGGLSLVLGIMIYNEVLILPCCGLKKSAKTSMKESQIYRDIKLQERSWQTKLDDLL